MRVCIDLCAILAPTVAGRTVRYVIRKSEAQVL